jgi:hypothetical protein
MKFSCRIAAMIALMAAAGAAIAQAFDAKATFYSDKVLRGALADIAKMPEDELRAFTHYLAECQDDDRTVASNRHACAAAQATYEIEFGNKRALDDLIIAKAPLSPFGAQKIAKRRVAAVLPILTLLHEASHWSGHEQRLNRDLTNRFGTGAYAAEELIAELTAAFLCAHLGLEGELRHAGYIDSWIGLLKDDPRAVFTAASKASQAADYLRSFSEGPLHAAA